MTLPDEALLTEDLADRKLAAIQTGQVSLETEIGRINADTRFSPQARAELAAVLSSDFQATVEATRAGLLPKLDTELEQIAGQESDLLRASRIQPKDAAAWAEANARALFVQEDVARLLVAGPDGQGGALADAFRQTLKDGDQVQAYLLARYGVQALERQDYGRALAQLERAIKEAEQPKDDATIRKLQALTVRRSQLARAKADWGMPLTKTDEQRIASRYGIR